MASVSEGAEENAAASPELRRDAGSCPNRNMAILPLTKAPECSVVVPRAPSPRSTILRDGAIGRWQCLRHSLPPTTHGDTPAMPRLNGHAG
jgi:hypothetical protein